MTTYETVIAIFTEMYNELTLKIRDDGTWSMPVYYDDQEYQEHYITFDHKKYCATLGFIFNEDNNTMSVWFTSDDEDGGTDSTKNLSENEEIEVRKKRDILIKMYKDKLDKYDIYVEWEVSNSPEQL
jgi:hypothetical protein